MGRAPGQSWIIRNPYFKDWIGFHTDSSRKYQETSTRSRLATVQVQTNNVDKNVHRLARPKLKQYDHRELLRIRILLSMA